MSCKTSVAPENRIEYMDKDKEEQAELRSVRVLDEDEPRIQVRFVWRDSESGFARNGMDVLSGEDVRRLMRKNSVRTLDGLRGLGAERGKMSWQKKADTGTSITINHMAGEGLNGWFVNE